MLLTVNNVERYFSDFTVSHREFLENVAALKTLSPTMETVKESHPEIYKSYCDLLSRADLELKILKRIQAIRDCFNPLNLFDYAASLGTARWMFDAFVLSRKLRAILH